MPGPEERALERARPPVQALLDRIREDAPVTRRDYLRILVTISGGLLAGTIAISAGVFRRRAGTVAPPLRVAPSLPPGASVRFAYPTAADPAIAIRLDDGTLVGYSSVCTHLSCAVLWNRAEGRIDCPCHNGEFDPRDGVPIAGPPQRPLPRVLLEERADGIYAVGTAV
ncbi:MAG TPA: Rieske 2Fe-2S domain-containing protein [Actinomycetota bacterium]|nr:Rieske 2Fe-2S domain-containing protein [Actinomycetota bacterium]